MKKTMESVQFVGENFGQLNTGKQNKEMQRKELKEFKCKYCKLKFKKQPAYYNGNKCCSVCFLVLRRNKGNYVTPVFPEDNISRDHTKKPYIFRRTNTSKLKQRLSVSKIRLKDVNEEIDKQYEVIFKLQFKKEEIEKKIEGIKLSLLKNSRKSI